MMPHTTLKKLSSMPFEDMEYRRERMRQSAPEIQSIGLVREFFGNEDRRVYRNLIMLALLGFGGSQIEQRILLGHVSPLQTFRFP